MSLLKRWMSSNALKVARLKAIRADGTTPKFFADVKVARLSDFSVPPSVEVPELPEGVSSFWIVLLDDRAMCTPFGSLFCVPSETLAHAIAGEWIAQEDRIKPALMPLMTLATTAIDIVPRMREKTLNDIVKFLNTDTVCFFADPKTEPGLREMQEEAFLPVIEWFEKEFDVTLATNKLSGDVALGMTQSPELLEKVKDKLSMLSDWELSALDKASGEAKSTCIATMLCSGKLSAKGALEACKTEEMYQLNRWGDVPQWHGVDFGLTRVLLAATNFFAKTLLLKEKV